MGFGEPKKYDNTTQEKTEFIQIGGIWEREGKLSGQLKLNVGGGETVINFKISKNKFKNKNSQPSYHMIVDGQKYPELRPAAVPTPGLATDD